ncbi:hypothetical protein KKB43_02315 [Patescibacteria group bacterium]|nr:hypothetical protein [Patescibacteria group bacterium]
MLISISASALPPSEIITCKGCILNQDSIDKFTTWVKKGSAITLTGPAGYTIYSWSTGETTQSINLKIDSSRVVTLYLNGNKVKTVQINLTSPVISCELVASEIKLDATFLTVGERRPVSVDFKENKCPDAVLSWTVDGGSSSGLIIEDSHIEKTWLIVKSKPIDGKNPIIRFKATCGGQSVEKTLMVTIGENSKPTIESLSTTPATPLSHRKVVMNCDKCFTGAGTRDQGDYIAEFIVRVISLDGKFDKTFTQPFGKDNIKPISVSVGSNLENDVYKVEARIKDSRGAYSEIFYDTIFVNFGNTDKDVPYVRLKEPIVCIGLECVFDTQETEDNDLVLSRSFEVKTVSGKFEPLFSVVTGSVCTAPVCRTVFRETGQKEVRIRMSYIRNGKKSDKYSEKFVTVCVGCANNNIQTSAAASYSAPLAGQVQPTAPVAAPPSTAVSGDDCAGYRCKSAPGIGGFALIAILAILSRKIKK